MSEANVECSSYSSKGRYGDKLSFSKRIKPKVQDRSIALTHA